MPQHIKLKIFYLSCFLLLASTANAGFNLKNVIKQPSSPTTTQKGGYTPEKMDADDIAYKKASDYAIATQKYLYDNFTGKTYNAATLASISKYLGTNYYKTEKSITVWYVKKSDWGKYCAVMDVSPAYDYKTGIGEITMAFGKTDERDGCKHSVVQ